MLAVGRMQHREHPVPGLARHHLMAAGFSLTELLVATTLLSIATAGGLTGFARAQAARRDAGVIQQLHERAQYAFASLEPELQLAGYFGTSHAPAPLDVHDVPEAARRCGVELVQRLDLPLQVENAWNLPCAPNGGGAMDSSSVLVVRRVSARPASAAEVGRAQWLSRLSGPQGHLYWHGDAPWLAGIPGEELRELVIRVYYVAQASDGDGSLPALRVKSLTSIAGVPAFIDTEVMPGVERMQVELLPSPSDPEALRLHLRIRGDTGAMRLSTEGQALDVTRYFSLRNADS